MDCGWEEKAPIKIASVTIYPCLDEIDSHDLEKPYLGRQVRIEAEGGEFWDLQATSEGWEMGRAWGELSDTVYETLSEAMDAIRAS